MSFLGALGAGLLQTGDNARFNQEMALKRALNARQEKELQSQLDTNSLENEQRRQNIDLANQTNPLTIQHLKDLIDTNAMDANVKRFDLMQKADPTGWYNNPTAVDLFQKTTNTKLPTQDLVTPRIRDVESGNLTLPTENIPDLLKGSVALPNRAPLAGTSDVKIPNLPSLSDVATASGVAPATGVKIPLSAQNETLREGNVNSILKNYQLPQDQASKDDIGALAMFGKVLPKGGSPFEGGFGDFIGPDGKEIKLPNSIGAAMKLQPFHPSNFTVVSTDTGLSKFDTKRGGPLTPIEDTNNSGFQEQPALPAQLKQMAVDRETANKLLEPVQTLGNRIVTKAGLPQRIQAMTMGLHNVVWGSNPEFKSYMDSRRGLATSLASIINKGRPTDVDMIAAADAYIPNPFTDSPESAAFKWNQVKTLLQEPQSEQVPLPNKNKTIPSSSAIDILKQRHAASQKQ